MGHKKKNFGIRKQSAGDVGETEPCDNRKNVAALSKGNVNNHRIKIDYSAETNDASCTTIKLECERALNALRRGNYTKSLRLMKESCSRHENSPHSSLIHRVQGTVYMKVASIIDDPNTKQRHLHSAVESARKAAELSPNSVEFSHFYANLLYEAANDSKEYEEVVKECQRGLEIENPVDPAKESLQDESQQRVPTPAARIEHVQNELRSLIQKSNIASLSTWMKNLGSGEEKFRLIPIRRVAEDPMEIRLAQSRRPNEIKKATKTPDERRKEIEVRVAAARLLQQKSESPKLQMETKAGDKGRDSSVGQRSERRKHGNARKTGSRTERYDWVSSYWKSMTSDMKRALLKVKVTDLEAFYSSSKNDLENSLLTEALSYAKDSKTWKFWICSWCNEKFADSGLHMKHVVQEHMGNVLPKMQLVMPQSIDDEWIEMLLNCPWKPLDLTTAAEMYETKSQEDSLKDSLVVPDKGNQEACNGCNEKKVCNIELNDIEGKKFPSLEEWPGSEDNERAKILERIHAAFELLIRHKYLAVSHLNKVLRFTMDELQQMAIDAKFLACGLDNSPQCICFLGDSQLRKILKFLQDLSHSCGLSRFSEKAFVPEDTSGLSCYSEVKEEVYLDAEGCFLILDEDLLSRKRNCVVLDDVATACAGYVVNENEPALNADGFLFWIYDGPSNGEELALWMRSKEERMHQGLEIMRDLEKEFCHLQNICERKCEQLSYEEALQAVEDLYLEENKKREGYGEFVYSSNESLLRKRREELIENDKDLVFISNRFELDAIENILKDAESLRVEQHGYEETYTGNTAQLCDFESSETDDRSFKDSMHQLDSSIGVAIQRQKEQLSSELSKIDARIMRSVSELQHLELKLAPISAHDYHSILLPLVKSYMRAHLEDLAEKDATQRSDAAREAFLAELALDSKKTARGDHQRGSHDKPREKKKTRDNRKARYPKGTEVTEQRLLETEGVDSGSYIEVACGADNLEPGALTYAEAVDDLVNHGKQGFKLGAEEEINAEQSLGYERQVENGLRRRQVARQNKELAFPGPLNAANVVPDDYYATTIDEHAYTDPIKHESQLQKNGFASKLEVIGSGGSNGAVMTMKSSVLSGSDSANGVTFEDGHFISEQRTGKRNRRQKAANKMNHDIKNLGVPMDEERVDAHGSHFERYHDNLTNIPASSLRDAGAKTLRELQAEEDEEERFQADLKMAVRESLDTYEAQKKMPMLSNTRMHPKMAMEVDKFGYQSDVLSFGDENYVDILGTGLQNEVGEYNCFLNVIIQSLWHLKLFRDGFLQGSASEHTHVGDPCVICALYDIFSTLNAAFTETRKVVSPTMLRTALSNLYPDSNFFQEAQMNDASEVMAVIFDCLHRSLAPSLNVSHTESVESNSLGSGSWDCPNSACLVHSIFGMDIFERMNCPNCGLESRHLKYTSFFHNINASALRTMKVMCADASSFDELLDLVERNHQLGCDLEAGGCGKPNHIHHILSSAPQVFTIVIGWQNTCESAEDIAATLATLSTEIDISIMYRGLDPRNRYGLVSVVCYYGQHYHCFAYSPDHERWIMYDDKTVKVIGSWADVLTTCKRGHLQPQVLFYEAVN